MEKTFCDQTAENLNEKLATYRDLLARKQDLHERLTKTEDKRHSVAEKIYRKVKEDYEVQLSKLDTELTPIETDIAETRQTITEQLGEVEKALETLGEELSEAEFRHVVGEHNKHDFESIEKRISPEINEKRKTKEELSTLLDRFESTPDSPNAESGDKADDRNGKLEGDDTFSVLADPLDEGSDISQAESQETSPSTPSEGESTGEPPSNAASAKAQSRIEEDPAEESPPNPSAGPTADTGEGESAEETPPKPHEAQEATEAAHQESKETPVTFPNLIILTGAQSGKKIPLHR
jgi:chromosome segregation ATPase